MKKRTLVRTRLGRHQHTLLLFEDGIDPEPDRDLSLPDTSDSANVLALLYDISAATFLDDWWTTDAEQLEHLGVIDIDETMRTATASSPDPSPASADPPPTSPPARNVIRGVESPTDTQTVRNHVDDYLRSWSPDATHTVLVLDSIRSVFDAMGADTAVEFLTSLMRRLESSNATGYFYLQPADADDGLASSIRPLFDTVVEISHAERDATSKAAANADPDPDPDANPDPDPDANPDPDPDANPEEAVTALGHRRRRNALRCLADADGPIPVRDLAARVRALEAGTGPATATGDESTTDENGTVSRAPTNEQFRRTAAGLAQIHLPKLHEAGFVEYDRETGTVERCQTDRDRDSPRSFVARHERA